MPKQELYVGNILTAARHLLTVINDILDLAKLQSGKARLDLAPVPLREVLDEAAALIEPLIERRRQTLSVDLPDTLPTLRANRAKIMQILVNLLSNAHKFTPEDKGIHVSATAAAGMVTVAVSDEGIGIAAGDLQSLLDEFRQVDHRRMPGQPQGTGLGLAITRSLVELHGGTISVQSVVGEGSTFRFTMPGSPA